MAFLSCSRSHKAVLAVFISSISFSTFAMWQTTRALAPAARADTKPDTKPGPRPGCARDPAEFYLPDDLKTCRQPRKVDWFNDFLAKNLVSNPLEPGCWQANNSCAPFPCSKLCEMERYQYLRKIWSAEKPGKQKVMAFQYGKVASSAIVEGMKAQLGIAVAHAHLPEHARQWMDGERPQIPLQVQGFAFSQEWSLKPGDECFIITATRSHFSRDPSEYFENILLPEHPYGYHPRGVRRYNDTPPVGTDRRWTEAKIMELGKTNVAILQEDFQIQHEIVIQAYSKWYSEVFFGATGINVLKQKFDRHKKHMLVRAETCQVLVLRFEDISEWSNIIGQYFPGFQMPKGANRAELKWYADAYKNFKSTLEYRPEELKAMCETETETHFYADDPSSECADADF